jgi:hypothetical protein
MHSTYPGKEQPYPPQMKRYLHPVLLWTVAATATSRVRLNASTLSTFYYEPPHLARMPPRAAPGGWLPGPTARLRPTMSDLLAQAGQK